MNKEIRRILKLEILGMLFISITGSFFHFTYALSGKSWLVGMFSAVNESTWEHLKLAVIPAVIWAVLELSLFKVNSRSFWCAKAAGIWLMPVLIVLFFYSYTAVLGSHVLAFDILIFILAVVIGQIVSYMIMARNVRGFDRISILSIVVLVLIFVVFTFYPPELFIFKDAAGS